MREVNFSIPNVNKASVGITAALYDRRALDSTSTLPLINSLNHLAYLTTSSARIRDILTVDGGIERLICILKEGRDKEMMEMWKWNLAFQCVVNIGVRGSEQVRKRVVEADVVPIIATLLENHSKAAEKAREEAEAERRRSGHRSGAGPSKLSSSSTPSRQPETPESRSTRRHAPASIHIPAYSQLHTPQNARPNGTNNDITPGLPVPHLALTSPQDSVFPAQGEQQTATWARQSFARNQHSRQQLANENRGNGYLSSDTADGFGLRSVRDSDRLPSHLPSLQNGITSQPESPTTPGVPMHLSLETALRAQRRPTLSQQNSGSGDSDDGGPEGPAGVIMESEEPVVDIQNSQELDGTTVPPAILDTMQADLDVSNANMADGADDDAINIARRPGSDGSIIPTNIPNGTTIDGRLSPVAGPLDPIGLPQDGAPLLQQRNIIERMTPPAPANLGPRDEDVLMSLQLLAYVSKYCNLRTYFQNTHLVPRLRADIAERDTEDLMEIDLEEYVLADDYNIFPLVEKFTVRHNSQDMQYWAGVVMRNLCRKDDSQGGIRQCAYYNCGKWEEWPRQFAKCRRCRRTKYCSKECQKNAWVFHRHWCQQASP